MFLNNILLNFQNYVYIKNIYYGERKITLYGTISTNIAKRTTSTLILYNLYYYYECYKVINI